MLLAIPSSSSGPSYNLALRFATAETISHVLSFTQTIMHRAANKLRSQTNEPSYPEPGDARLLVKEMWFRRIRDHIKRSIVDTVDIFNFVHYVKVEKKKPAISSFTSFML